MTLCCVVCEGSTNLGLLTLPRFDEPLMVCHRCRDTTALRDWLANQMEAACMEMEREGLMERTEQGWKRLNRKPEVSL